MRFLDNRNLIQLQQSRCHLSYLSLIDENLPLSLETLHPLHDRYLSEFGSYLCLDAIVFIYLLWNGPHYDRQRVTPLASIKVDRDRISLVQ